MKMANLEEKKDEHRELFEKWLSMHATSERSLVISTTEYEAIKLLVPWTKNHLSSLKCDFLNNFSRQNLSGCL